MRARSLRALLLAGLLLAATLAQAAAPALPSPGWLLDQVRVLAGPEMEGRASGTPGAARAAAHVARVFAEAGLKPPGEHGSFLQPFTVPVGIRLGTHNSLTLMAPSVMVMTVGRDFMPLAASADGAAEASLVFVGYGITAPELGYDDYAGLDVRGRIVLALMGAPRAGELSDLLRDRRARHHAERSHKLVNAREHGAAGILLVAHPEDGDGRLPRLRGSAESAGVLAAAVTPEVADELLAPAGRRLADAVAAIDRTGRPGSFPIPARRARLTVRLIRERATAANVVGILPGTDARRREEAVLVGAHYDHLGRGGFGSLARDADGHVHHGADDNASGTAAVMALARAFAAAGATPRTLVFVAFGGEEMGLLGSRHYIQHPSFPLDRTVLMLNLDMVGRLRDGPLHVGGVDSGQGLRAIVEEAARGSTLALQIRGTPFVPSDHVAFYRAGRPVLFLHTGVHADYHRPTDTWDRIDAAGLASITAFAARVVAAVAALPAPPAYVKLEAPARGGRGYGPLFGVMPEFGPAEQPGVTVAAVSPGSPADRAGVREGDVIVEFAGVQVKTLDDLMFALGRRRPGDRVEVVIVRDGQPRGLSAVLEER